MRPVLPVGFPSGKRHARVRTAGIMKQFNRRSSKPCHAMRSQGIFLVADLGLQSRPLLLVFISATFLALSPRPLTYTLILSHLAEEDN